MKVEQHWIETASKYNGHLQYQPHSQTKIKRSSHTTSFDNGALWLVNKGTDLFKYSIFQSRPSKSNQQTYYLIPYNSSKSF